MGCDMLTACRHARRRGPLRLCRSPSPQRSTPMTGIRSVAPSASWNYDRGAPARAVVDAAFASPSSAGDNDCRFLCPPLKRCSLIRRPIFVGPEARPASREASAFSGTPCRAAGGARSGRAASGRSRRCTPGEADRLPDRHRPPARHWLREGVVDVGLRDHDAQPWRPGDGVWASPRPPTARPARSGVWDDVAEVEVLD
jgi:hypothetical protein